MVIRWGFTPPIAPVVNGGKIKQNILNRKTSSIYIVERVLSRDLIDKIERDLED